MAKCLEVNVASQGESLELAIANLREALELYFEDAPTTDIPNSPIIAPVDVTLAPHC